jgi:signal transduction histidine kinase
MAGTRPARVEVRLRADETTFVIGVSDSGQGLDPARADDAFRRGWTTKGDGRGLGLAMVGQAVRRAGGTIAVGGTDRDDHGDHGDHDGHDGHDGHDDGDGHGRTHGAVFTVRLPLNGRETP